MGIGKALGAGVTIMATSKLIKATSKVSKVIRKKSKRPYKINERLGKGL